MKIKKTILLALFAPLLWAYSFGEEVHPYGKNRFITDKNILESSAAPEARVLIRSAASLSGRLRVIADDIDKTVLEYRKILKTSNRPNAVEYADATEVNIQKTSKGIIILFQTPNPAPWPGIDKSVVIEGELRLPEDCHIAIDADYFDLDIEGPFLSVENNSSFGRLDIRNVTKLLDLTSSNRNINLKDIKGDISVSATHADIWIENMMPESKPARIRNENGNIYINGFEGTFNIRNSYGKIRLSDIDIITGNSSIAGIQCPIKVAVRRIGNAELFISNAYDDVELILPEKVSANFFLKTELDGEVHVKGMAVKPILVKSNYLELISGEGNCKVKIGVDGGGDIGVSGHPVSVKKK